MLPAAVAARIAADAYSQEPTWTVGTFDAIRMQEGRRAVVAIRGTTANPLTWAADATAFPVYDGVLGCCDAGFLLIARLFWRVIHNAIGPHTAFVGHSLGGAVAVLLGALAAAENRGPHEIVTFGAPRAGSWKLRRLLADVPMRMFRNGDDPVPLVPWIPLVYLHPRKNIEIGAAAVDPIEDHRIASYQAVLEE
ncbi:MAG: lipase family protein [Acidiferrobacteraceae bacterium]